MSVLFVTIPFGSSMSRLGSIAAGLVVVVHRGAPLCGTVLYVDGASGPDGL